MSLPATLRAIALDANCMPKGMFTERVLEGLSDELDRLSIDAAIWIPEPVLWEWAEHTSRARRGAIERMEADAKTLVKSGVDPLRLDFSKHIVDVEEVLDELEDILAGYASVKVLRCSDYPNSARDGLRDQVLQLGVGRLKTGSESVRVKTGGADSTSFRLIELEAGDNLADVALISSDKDAQVHFAGGPITIVSGVHQLKVALLADVPALTDAKMLEALRGAVAEALEEPAVLSSVSTEGSADLDYEPEHDDHLTMDVNIERVAEVTQVVAVEADRREGYFVGEASILLDVEYVGWRWNDRDDELESDSVHAVATPATLQFSADRHNGDWRFTFDHLMFGVTART